MPAFRLKGANLNTRAERKVDVGARGVTARAKQMLRVGFVQAPRRAGETENFLSGFLPTPPSEWPSAIFVIGLHNFLIPPAFALPPNV